MITLQKRDLVAGAIIRGFLATADEGRAINDHLPDPETLIQMMLMRFGAPLVGDRLGLAYPHLDVETSNVRRWRSDHISALNAWRLGEALRWSDDVTPALLPQASGLLALVWTGHLKDVVAVVAGCARTILAEHEARLLGMLGTLEPAAYISPFDGLPPEQFPLVGATDEDLRRLVEVGTPPRTIPTYGAEARRLQSRADAWTIWTLPGDLHAAAVAAADAWFGLSAAEQAVTVEHWSNSLRVAHDVGRSNVGRATAATVIREWLLRWFYSAGAFEPPPFSVGQYLMMLINPDHPDATAMLRGFRSYTIDEAP